MYHYFNFNFKLLLKCLGQIQITNSVSKSIPKNLRYIDIFHLQGLPAGKRKTKLPSFFRTGNRLTWLTIARNFPAYVSNADYGNVFSCRIILV